MIEDLENQLEEQDTDFDTIIERIMHIENERFEQYKQKNEKELAHVNEMLVKTKAREEEQTKKLRRAEKKIELSQKSGSLD